MSSGQSVQSNEKNSTPHLKVQVWIYAKNPQTSDFSVLILKTCPDRGGFWQPVTGSVDPGEAIEAAALREATEETGLSFFANKLVPLDDPFEFQSRWGNRVREYGFALSTPQQSDVKLDPHEHVEYRWVSPHEALNIIAFPSNAQILRSLIRLMIPVPEKE